MPDAPDYDLRHESGAPASTPPETSGGVWMLVALVVVLAAAIAAFFVIRGRRALSHQPPPQTTTQPAAPDTTSALGPAVAPIDLPPLEATDPLVRDLVRKLSSNPRVAAWLTTDGLIRNFTVVVSNIAEGRAPAGQLGVLRPQGSFRVLERGDAMVVDPVSFTRYDTLGDAVASIDPEGAARLYAMLKPRLEEAHRELGPASNVTFDQNLERAIVSLLRTPVPDGNINVEPQGIVYGFADERTEALTPAQKQLLRMGPRNVRLVQRQLRSIAIALGIPEGRLK